MNATDTNREGSQLFRRIKPSSPLNAVTAMGFGVVAGILTGLASAGSSRSIGVFLIVTVVSTGYLWRQPTFRTVVGTGMYIWALVAIGLPIVGYITYNMGYVTSLNVPDSCCIPHHGLFFERFGSLLHWLGLNVVMALPIVALGYHYKHPEWT